MQSDSEKERNKTRTFLERNIDCGISGELKI